MIKFYKTTTSESEHLNSEKLKQMCAFIDQCPMPFNYLEVLLGVGAEMGYV